MKHVWDYRIHVVPLLYIYNDQPLYLNSHF